MKKKNMYDVAYCAFGKGTRVLFSFLFFSFIISKFENYPNWNHVF